VILQAVAAAAGAGSLGRDGVRAAGTDTAATFKTIMGSLRFDAAGDLTAPSISIDAVDPKANGGAGGWVVLRPGASAP
jgi:ABC-type branched-subunit amino acid transport system substrate-binding protein